MQESSVLDLENLCGVDPLVNTFCELISYDTKADPDSSTVPSSVGQLRFGAYLLSAINKLGLKGIQDDNGVVSVSIPASKGYENVKSLCLLAHMDTAPDKSGADIKPALVKNYDGSGIRLANSLVIDDSVSPSLKEFEGQDIIVTDGNTLLGADDKAGIAILLRLMHEICVDSNLVHGPLKIIFSVDEEIGKSTDHLSVSDIDCDYGLTVDGTKEGELDIATFNAYGATVNFKGRSVHTAVAYKTLHNALMIANEFINMLPSSQRPETTYGDEGFYHIHDLSGTTDSANLKMIIRDFTKDGMQRRLDTVKSIISFLNNRYSNDTVDAKFTFQYANMADVLKDHENYISLIKDAYTDAGVNVVLNKVRGGTDGSNLSNRGLPTPNVFTGGLNCHGPYECLVVSSFNKAYAVVRNLVTSMHKLS